MERHQKAIDTHFAPTAMLTSLYANCHMKENAQPTSPDDFIPGRAEAKRRAIERVKRVTGSKKVK